MGLGVVGGCVGWKYYSCFNQTLLAPDPDTASINIGTYLVLRSFAGLIDVIWSLVPSLLSHYS